LTNNVSSSCITDMPNVIKKLLRLKNIKKNRNRSIPPQQPNETVTVHPSTSVNNECWSEQETEQNLQEIQQSTSVNNESWSEQETEQNLQEIQQSTSVNDECWSEQETEQNLQEIQQSTSVNNESWSELETEDNPTQISLDDESCSQQQTEHNLTQISLSDESCSQQQTEHNLTHISLSDESCSEQETQDNQQEMQLSQPNQRYHCTDCDIFFDNYQRFYKHKKSHKVSPTAYDGNIITFQPGEEKCKLLKYNEDVHDKDEIRQIVAIPWANDEGEHKDLSIGATTLADTTTYAKNIWKKINHGIINAPFQQDSCGSGREHAVRTGQHMVPTEASSLEILAHGKPLAEKVKGHVRKAVDSVRIHTSDDLGGHLQPTLRHIDLKLIKHAPHMPKKNQDALQAHLSHHYGQSVSTETETNIIETATASMEAVTAANEGSLAALHKEFETLKSKHAAEKYKIQNLIRKRDAIAQRLDAAQHSITETEKQIAAKEKEIRRREHAAIPENLDI
jgi:hypothetical protein